MFLDGFGLFVLAVPPQSIRFLNHAINADISRIRPLGHGRQAAKDQQCTQKTEVKFHGDILISSQFIWQCLRKELGCKLMPTKSRQKSALDFSAGVCEFV